jgi:hypothetical protein
VSALLAVLGIAAGGAVGLSAGLWLGGRLVQRPQWLFWAANLGMLGVGVVVDAVGLLYGIAFVAMAGPGFAAGGLAGLRYGFGRAIGPWVLIERLLGKRG